MRVRSGFVAAAATLALTAAAALAPTPPVAEAKAIYTWKEARNAKIPKASDITAKQKKKYYNLAEDEFERNIKSNQRILASASSSSPASSSPASSAERQQLAEDSQRIAAAGVWQDIKDELTRYDICNPYGKRPNRNFCSPSKAYKDYMYEAWAWGKKHPDKEDWKPAHKPTKGTGLTNKWGFVYVITYRPKGFIGPISQGGSVWKFGETAQDDWRWRAGLSYAQCDLAQARVCDVELVAITERYPSKYIARWVEAAAVAKWNREYSSRGLPCPPGHNPSCR